MRSPLPDSHFHNLAAAQSRLSRCVRRQVGAIVSNRHGTILGQGYNDSQDGKRFCDLGDCPRGLLSAIDCPPYTAGNHNYSNCIAVHAEVAALTEVSYNNPRVSGLTLWTTHEPCGQCKRFIEDWAWAHDPLLVTRWP